MRGRPRIGVTAEVVWRTDVRPARAHYELDAQLACALHEAGALVSLLTHEGGGDTIDQRLDDLDGIVLSGGLWRFPSPWLVDNGTTGPTWKLRRARFEIGLCDAAIERALPVLGICGGFQILNRALGGELVVNLATWSPSFGRHLEPDRSLCVHTVRPEQGTRFASCVGDEAFAVNSEHGQGVLRVGADAVIAARSDDGLVEAIERPGSGFALGVQWHPEFLLSAQDGALLRAFVAASI